MEGIVGNENENEGMGGTEMLKERGEKTEIKENEGLG